MPIRMSGPRPEERIDVSVATRPDRRQLRRRDQSVRVRRDYMSGRGPLDAALAWSGVTPHPRMGPARENGSRWPRLFPDSTAREGVSKGRAGWPGAAPLPLLLRRPRPREDGTARPGSAGRRDFTGW